MLRLRDADTTSNVTGLIHHPHEKIRERLADYRLVANMSSPPSHLCLMILLPTNPSPKQSERKRHQTSPRLMLSAVEAL